MTTPNLLWQKDVREREFFNANPALIYNDGDLLYYNTATFFVEPVTGTTVSAYFVGQCEGAFPTSSNIDNGTANPAPGVTVLEVGVTMLNGTAGDSYTHGQAVYIGADAQTVMQTSTGTLIGYVWLPTGPSSIAGVANLRIPVRMLTNYPAISY